MKSNQSEQLSDVENSMSRIRSQQLALLQKLKRFGNAQRKARTRTLIQIGGLVDLTPLLSICEIKLGEDLQLESPDKAALLLGIISDMCQRLPDQINEGEQSKFKDIGINLLKQQWLRSEDEM